jgi:prepilin-type N-terminal cleavage/methylation domain-containing protein
MQRGRVAGFTLIEMLIVVVVFGVMTMVAFPAISRITTHARVNQAIALVGHDLSVAVSNAARERKPIRIARGVDRRERPGERDRAVDPVLRTLRRHGAGFCGDVPHAGGHPSERVHLEHTGRAVVGGGILPPARHVARRMGAGPMKQTEGGFSLIEIVVAMMLLSFFLVGLAKVDFTIARRFYTLSAGGARDGIVSQTLNQFAALQFDSLKGKAGTITVNKPPMPYTRTITVDSLSPKMRRVTIVITPINTLFKPDTMVLQRSKPGNNPFNLP